MSKSVLIEPKEDEIKYGNYMRLRSGNGQCIWVDRGAKIEEILKEGFLLWREGPASGRPELYRRPL